MNRLKSKIFAICVVTAALIIAGVMFVLAVDNEPTVSSAVEHEYEYTYSDDGDITGFSSTDTLVVTIGNVDTVTGLRLTDNSSTESYISADIIKDCDSYTKDGITYIYEDNVITASMTIDNNTASTYYLHYQYTITEDTTAEEAAPIEIFEITCEDSGTIGSFYAAKGNTLTCDELPELAKTGYTFKGWYLTETDEDGNETEKLIEESTKVEITSNITLSAKWEANTYEVEFVTGTEETLDVLKVEYDSTYEGLPTLERTGYTFKGWYLTETDEDGNETEKLIEESTKVEITSNITLSAKWEANSYTITFNANGGEGEMSSLGMTYDEAKTLTANVYSRTGYTFKEWNTSKDGSGTSYSDKKSVKNLTAKSGGTVTLYAQWTANEYTVKFNPNSGKVSTTSIKVTYDSTYGTLPTPTRTGYTFKGWYTAASGGSKITANSKVTITGTTNLYAQWSINSYKITLKANKGKYNGSSTTTVTKKYGTKYTLPTKKLTRTGYTFKGWYTKASGGTKVKSITVSKARTLYAQWSKVTVSSKFKLKSVKQGSGKQIVVKVSNVKKVAGYRIELATKKTFKKSVTKYITIKSSTKSSYTIKSTSAHKLTYGKYYYVRVRGYKLDSAGKKVWGTASDYMGLRLRR